MLSILSITFPIFGCIALGYGAVARGIFSQAEMKVFGRFVLNIALPALLFRAVAERDLGEVMHADYLAVYLAGGLASIAVSYGWFRLRGTGPARRAVGAMGASCPNSGYVGYPVLLLAFPSLAATALAMNLVIENFILLPICTVLLELSRPRDGRGVPALAWGVIRSVLTRPFVLGLLAGIAVAATGLPLPSGLTRLADMLASSLAGIALFCIGGTLVGLPLRGNWRFGAEVTVGKLVVMPLLTALAVALVPMLSGLPPLGPEMRAVVILSAAMPMLGIYTVFAQAYGHEGIAAIAMLMATSGAFVTLTLLLALLG